jgi:rhodanese-related sulfurtransferase
MKTFLIILSTGLYFPSFAQSDYDEMLREYYKGTVPTISSEKLYLLLSENKTIHILDARTRKEFEVSSIKGAVRFGMSVSSKKMADVDKNDMIVVYCTIGARSETLGEKIKRSGYTNVFNLYGGVIEWVNKGYPLYRNSKKTEEVHVYSKEWGKWLTKGKAVY